MANYLYSSNRLENQNRWMSIIEDYHLSQLNQQEFCRLNHISFPAFAYWLRRSREVLDFTKKVQNDLRQPEFVELDTAFIQTADPILEVSRDSLHIRFYSGADRQLIQSVLQELSL